MRLNEDLAATPAPLPETGPTNHVDIQIVGAGISGIGSACHLQTQCAWASYAILETLDGFGGAWCNDRAR